MGSQPMKHSTLADMIADRPLHTTSPDDSVRIACITMSAKNIGALPVVNDNGDLVGMLSERDVIRRSVIVYRPSEETPVKNIMTADPKWLPPEAEPPEAVQIMLEGGFRHLPVCTDGHVVGIVSIRDFDLRDNSVIDRPKPVRKHAS